MQFAASGSKFGPSGFLCKQRRRGYQVTRPCRRSDKPLTQAVADFVKEKSSTSSNGVRPVHLDASGSSLQTDIIRKASYVVGSEELEPSSAYRATALSVREHLIEAFNKTQKFWKYVPLNVSIDTSIHVRWQALPFALPIDAGTPSDGDLNMTEVAKKLCRIRCLI